MSVDYTKPPLSLTDLFVMLVKMLAAKGLLTAADVLVLTPATDPDPEAGGGA